MERISGLVFLIAFALLSCEKVIELPLNEAPQQIVIEAVIKDGPGNNYVKLSKSGTVYTDSEFDKIEDATISVSDNLGNIYEFAYQEDGVYHSDELTVEPGVVYQLLVMAEGQSYSAVCQTKSKPKIDSLTYAVISGQFGIPLTDTVNLISFHSVDNVSEKNFYWIRIFRNGEVNAGYYLGNDAFINGSYYEAQFFGAEAKNGDTVFVEMISMDEANYNYFIGLSNALTTGPFAVAPANPPSNISNNALGFFGAYSTDTLSIIIPN